MKIIDENLLAEFRGKTCEVCCLHPGEPHHIRAKGIGGGGRLDHRLNIVALCRMCHTLAHNGADFGLLEIVACREMMTVKAVGDELDRLRRLDRDGAEPRRKGSDQCYSTPK